jgi:hypothetical protein
MTEASRPGDIVFFSAGKGRFAAGIVAALAVLAGVSVIAGGMAGDSPWFEPRRVAASYLTAIVFLASITVGALAWVMLHHLTGAVWSVVVRRLLENLTRPLLWIAVLFIPVVLNLEKIYPWADASRVAADPELARKSFWLNPTFFTVRSAIYFASWILVSGLLMNRSARQDHTADPADESRMKATSAWGLALVALTTSFAATDWIMSLDPHWLSTMFGVYFWAGSLLSSLAALVFLVLAFHTTGWLRSTVTVEHLHDLGKLLFGFVVFWAYIAFCQYFLIWYADFPEETHWYAERRSELWNSVSWSLVFGHFAVPFFLLLFRSTKRSRLWLGFIAGWILVFHYIDLYWLIMPASGPRGAKPHWLDGALALTLGLTCGAIVALACSARALVPVGDRHLPQSASFRNS